MQEAKEENRCKSCNEKIFGKFCHNCGEKKLSREDFTVKKFIGQAVDIITHFDSKVLKNALYLVTKPGFMASEYLEGRRVKYAKPIQLFFVLNVIYFIVLNKYGFDTVTNQLEDYMKSPVYGSIVTTLVNNKLANENIPLEEYSKIFYDKIYVHSHVLIIAMIPLFALVLMLIYRRQNRLYFEHLVFSTYFFSFVLLFYTFVMNLIIYPLYEHFDSNFYSTNENDYKIPVYIDLILFIVYLFISMKLVYKQSTAMNILNTILAVSGLITVYIIYTFILFLTVYLTS